MVFDVFFVVIRFNLLLMRDVRRINSYFFSFYKNENS